MEINFQGLAQFSLFIQKHQQKCRRHKFGQFFSSLCWCVSLSIVKYVFFENKNKNEFSLPYLFMLTNELPLLSFLLLLAQEFSPLVALVTLFFYLRKRMKRIYFASKTREKNFLLTKTNEKHFFFCFENERIFCFENERK